MKKLIIFTFVLLLLASFATAAFVPGTQFEFNATLGAGFYNVSSFASLNSSSGNTFDAEIGPKMHRTESTWTTGKIGNSALLSGGGDSRGISSNLTSIWRLQRHTWSFWVNLTAAPGNWDNFFGYSDGAEELSFGFDNGGVANLWVYWDGGGTNIQAIFTGAGTAVQNNNWSHIVIQFNDSTQGDNSQLMGADITVWVNGVNFNSTTTASTLTSNAIASRMPFYGSKRQDGTASANELACKLDEILYWNETAIAWDTSPSRAGIADGWLLSPENVTLLYNMGYSKYSPGPPPAPVEEQPGSDFINFTVPFPTNNTQYYLNTLNFNVTVNATNNSFRALLFINGTWNQTRNFTNGSDVFVSFNVTIPDGDYTYSINATAFNNNTRNDTTSEYHFFIDSTDPTFSTTYLNNTVLYLNNLTGSFTFTDEITLYSFNVSIDGIQVDSLLDLNISTYTYNLSYNVSSLSLGEHSLTVRFTDGHTAKELGGDYSFNNGLFNDYSKYSFWDGGWVKTSVKDGSLFDSWTSKREFDRYTQELTLNKPSETVVLVEESSYPIHLIHKPGHYNDYWIIVGNHWKDYVIENEPDVKLSFNQINPYKVEITISGIKNTERLKFRSIGELNVVQTGYNFTVTQVTSTYDAIAQELESQTFTFDINVTGNVSATNALLFYDGVERSVTKTSYTGYDRYTTSFTIPEIPGSDTSLTKNFYWRYQINGSGANETKDLNYTQTIYLIGLDNCTTYTMPALTIALRDESNNDALMNGTIDGFFRTWIASINNYTTHNISWFHDVASSPSRLCIFPNESIIYSYAQLEYTAPGYETKLYYFDNTTFDNSSETLNLYLNNGTSIVTFTVTDFNDVPVKDVLIKILSYDVGTDTSVVTEIIKTDTDGEALGQVVLNTQWYRFILELDGEVVQVTEPTKITSTSKSFQINLVSDYFDRFSRVREIQHWLRFINSTKQFEFWFTDSSGGINQGCLKVVRKGLNSDFTIDEQCETTAGATIIITIDENVSTNTYEATSSVVFSDGEYFVLDKLTVSFDYRYKQYGISGIFVSFLIVLVLVMIGIWSPPVSVGLMTLGFFLSVVIGIFHMKWEILVAFIIMAGITMYKVSRN